MNVYILGAGASHASVKGANKVLPPLINELLHEKYFSKFGLNNIGMTEEKLREFRNDITKNSKTLEQWMTDRWTEVGKYNSQKKKASLKEFGQMTWYIYWLMQFLSQQFDENNLYNIFVNKIIQKGDEFGFINFNYDTLLDQAYQKAGANLSLSIDNYLSNDTNYVKPHGSVNWLLQKRENEDYLLQELNIDIAGRYDHSSLLMYNGGKISMKSMIIPHPSHKDLANINLVANNKFNGKFCYPLILLPFIKKMDDHIEDFSEKVKTAARDLCSRATAVYLIGYSASDEIAKELLQSVERKCLLHVIGLDQASEIMNKTIKWNQNFSKGAVFKLGFDDFVFNYL